MLSPRFRSARALALLAATLLPLACGSSRHAPQTLLVVVIDTLRADRLGAYGNARGLTPFLDGLARRGTVFEHAYAPSSWTMPSVASLFTSRYPAQHHVTTFFSRLTDEELTLFERLRDAGWQVGGFSANPNLRVEAGFGQGFADYWASQTSDLPGDALRARALAWVDRVRAADPGAPLALYLQYMEPHEPYTPAEPFRSRFVVDGEGRPFDAEREVRDAIERAYPGTGVDAAGRPLDLGEVGRRFLARRKPTPEEVAWFRRLHGTMEALLYDAEVAAADEQIRRLFADLEARGVLGDDTLIVVTADHGEEFLEHGGTRHGYTLYEESVRVPLLLVGPGVPAGRRVSANVSLLDLAPTVLDLLGLAPEARFEGRSLRPLPGPGAAASGERAGDVLLELDRLFTDASADRRTHARALVRRREKLLLGKDGGVERYDLAADPGEARNDASGDGGPLRDALRAAEAPLAQRAGRAAFAPPDDGMQDRLRALGYVQ